MPKMIPISKEFTQEIENKLKQEGFDSIWKPIESILSTKSIPKFYIGDECTYTDPTPYMSGCKSYQVIIEDVRKFKNEYKYIFRKKEEDEVIKVWFSEDTLSKGESK